MSTETEQESRPRFFGPAVFAKVIERFDIGQGDRFYDDPRAYTEPWQDDNPVVRSSLVVTYASRGELGTVQYQIEERVPGASEWKRGPKLVTTQREFAKLVTVLP